MTRSAGAQPQTSALELQYEAPAECPTRSEVEAAALRLAGQIHRAPVVATVYVEKHSQGYRAHVRTHAGARQRLLEDVSCATVAEAIEVLLALAIDPDARVGSSEALSNAPSFASTDLQPTTRPDDGSQTPRESHAVSPGLWYSYPTPSAALPPAQSTPWWRISALLGIETGALPHPAEVVTGRLGIALGPRWSLSESGHLWRHSSTTLPGETRVGGKFSLWAVSSEACHLAVGKHPLLSICAGLEAGRMSGESFGVLNNGSGAVLWLMPVGGIEARMPVSGWFSLLLEAAMGVPMLRRGFYLQEFGAAHSSRVHLPAPFSARLNFGLSLSF